MADSSKAQQRLEATVRHLTAASGRDPKPNEEIRTKAFPAQRHQVLKWNGWGYKDSAFELNEKGVVVFRGSRYEVSGMELPLLRKWIEEERGMDINDKSPSQLPITTVQPAIRNEGFISAVSGHHGAISFDASDRLFRSHGHTCQEIFTLRHGKPGRVPDMVVWPECHDHVERIVAAAVAHNVVIIPFGGGTSVTGALVCPEEERRMIVSLDTSKMNRILWIDKKNLTIRVEAGIVGIELERKLAEYGVCTGHEPDSQEFSTVGGWIATRASGMKKNVYGNIEDLVVRARIVTPTGTVEKSCQVPRMSCGPDINHFIMGSEGTLGVITEATLKVRPLPEAQEFGSIVFPDFASGVACMRAIAEARCQPASIRLVDNEQFQFGRALKPAAHSLIAKFVDDMKTLYVTKFKGFKPLELCVATLLFEGTKDEVQQQQKRVYEFAAQYKGLAAGSENGKRGYLLTFVIAYLRDLGFEYKYLSESFETSVPWSRVEDLCRNTKKRILTECKKLGITGSPLASCRVTQVYDAGACIYFYFGFSSNGLKDPLAAFHHIEVTSRDECIANGGSISHHHGVGKVRKQWVTDTLSEGGVEMIRAVKERVDPKNIFGNGNLIP